ncbi:hypothetical protein [Streptomyces sp. NPDC005538]|uniref:hypothetical protein n=1 Tax=unclassified Streptomyces TaxID=2593676 RepID=UPI0033BC1A82
MPTDNALPAQETGTRPARELPYQPNGYLDHLEFGSSGKILAWFAAAGTTSPWSAPSRRTGHRQARDLLQDGQLGLRVGEVHHHLQPLPRRRALDLSVAVDSDASWSRRFTGHLESGTASVSG